MGLYRRIAGRLLAGVFCAVILLTVGRVTSEAAVNKAARITMTFPKNVTEENIHANESFHVTFCFNGKTTINKSTTISSEIYIPEAALKKKGSLVVVEPALEITGTKWHTISAKYNFRVRNKNGKIVVTVTDNGSAEKKAASSLATCKKSGKYYKLTIKKCPIKSSYTQWDGDKATTKKVKKETAFVNQVYFVRCNRKLTKKLFYWDNLRTTAKKTQTMTFDKADYTDVFGHDYYKDKDLTIKITKIK